jgi:hypothetical protein
MRTYYLFAQRVNQKTQQPLENSAPYLLGKPDFKMSHDQVIAFKKAQGLHKHLIYIIHQC